MADNDVFEQIRQEWCEGGDFDGEMWDLGMRHHTKQILNDMRVWVLKHPVEGGWLAGDMIDAYEKDLNNG